ncbi:hypothetical protein [Naumannella cuiyingiana]|uniref:ATP/GTP-binding protein n=1 Tax=Naumannella cuiyingiana TaxID=1347891 RepID=A0A7Z0D6B3_9ACTN|nr:hypothetical protein [Naumannella cuiyingiana]NYI69700.1 hypothetical protein [Naumannella cuiyingiana]
MARRPSKHLRPARPLSAGLAADASAPAGWVVRRVSGAGALKEYRCPGCQRPIAAGTPHLVAWRSADGAAERRHWHHPCWLRFGPEGGR